MTEQGNMLHEEIEDLKKELEHFQVEKERVRAIIGKIGGVPTFGSRFFNIIFVIIILSALIVSIVMPGTNAKLTMFEVATATLSIKIIYLIYSQNRVNHFQLWMLSSLEWRLNEIMKIVRKTDKTIK